jgi:hypothetical protein
LRPGVPICETRENDHEMKDVPIEDPNQKALLNQMIIASHLVRQLAEKDAYLNSLKEQRAEALAEIVWLKQQISEIRREASPETG